MESLFGQCAGHWSHLAIDHSYCNCGMHCSVSEVIQACTTCVLWTTCVWGWLWVQPSTFVAGRALWQCQRADSLKQVAGGDAQAAELALHVCARRADSWTEVHLSVGQSTDTETWGSFLIDHFLTGKETQLWLFIYNQQCGDKPAFVQRTWL